MDPAPHADRDQRILALWERAIGRPRWDRDDALLRDAGAPLALGERNRALLAIRNFLFGRDWALKSACPGCGAECEFAVDGVALAQSLDSPPPAGAEIRFEWQGRPLAARAPTLDDLRAVAGHGEAGGAARALLARCLSGDVDPARLDEDEVDLLGGWIERADPAAAVIFALACPACGEEWPAPLDLAEALWAEVQRSAEQALVDVDALARAYGWTEDQVMALSPVRRAAYLQLVGAP